MHILTHVHPSISLAGLVKDIKLASSSWIRVTGKFRNFNGWQEGYGAFTYSEKEKDRLIEYVKEQKEHHKIKTFREEYINLLIEQGIQFNEKYPL
jgi:putative transposase